MSETKFETGSDIWQWMNMPKVRSSRDHSYDWQSEPKYVWQDDAACAYQPHTLFEVAFPGDPVTEGLSGREIKDLNETNLAAAKKICDGCPVWDQCYSSAEPEDFKFTMRAGVMPTKQNTVPLGRPVRATSGQLKNDHTKPCKNNHPVDEWRERPEAPGTWYCQGCKRDQRGATKVVRMDGTQPCKEGHDPEMQVQDKQGYWRCGDCKRLRDNKYRKAKNEAKKAAKLAG